MLRLLPSSAQELDKKSLKDILSKQGFSGLLEGKVTFELLGSMQCNSSKLQVYYYTWEETNPPGRAVHFSQRLIFIENREYKGHYVVEDHPALLNNQTLLFPIHETMAIPFNATREACLNLCSSMAGAHYLNVEAGGTGRDGPLKSVATIRWHR